MWFSWVANLSLKIYSQTSLPSSTPKPNPLLLFPAAPQYLREVSESCKSPTGSQGGPLAPPVSLLPLKGEGIASWSLFPSRWDSCPREFIVELNALKSSKTSTFSVCAPPLGLGAPLAVSDWG